ncbi:hypothetical protein [Paenibacillus lutrae]|uniref:Uncharacterized protein n=1 Tax=Paenibacillus lutrae TaxID=2078573 RepID=A0A7X3K0C2_9BACL|nr:hypothetical protein [Paenibacillus lutrae]MVP00801.1 hypothetical protein [Paenibacillus lutrae]
MSTFTQHLKLIQPELSDETHQTILDLADNFQKIDDAAEKNAPQIPTTGIYPKEYRLWNTSPAAGSYIGWVNTRTGAAAPFWQSYHRYHVGDLVVPAADNGHYYKCIHAGTSAIQEPSFPISSNAKIEDRKASSTWSPSRNYNHHDIVVPTVPNGFFYVCTVAGLSYSSEPKWMTSEGATTTDQSVTWTAYPLVTWEEQGTACLFRPFGKIE